MELSSFTLSESATVKEALELLNTPEQGKYLTVFVLNNRNELLGVASDGDIRRALVRGVSTTSPVTEVINREFYSFKASESKYISLSELKEKGVSLVPILDNAGTILRIVDTQDHFSILPIEVVIMAGGKGTRLRPLTENTPKPLLKVGDRPIMEWNIKRLLKFGVHRIHISINYLGEQIQSYFQSQEYASSLSFVKEDKPMGTLGSVQFVRDELKSETLLIMNSDLLTDIDYEDFYREFIDSDADLAMLSIPYEVKVPYAVLETDGQDIRSFQEKPTYTYYSNGGVYLMKRSILEMVPKGEFYDATNLFEEAISKGLKVIHYSHPGYWLDIGKHRDFEKAQLDIERLKLL